MLFLCFILRHDICEILLLKVYKICLKIFFFFFGITISIKKKIFNPHYKKKQNTGPGSYLCLRLRAASSDGPLSSAGSPLSPAWLSPLNSHTPEKQSKQSPPQNVPTVVAAVRLIRGHQDFFSSSSFLSFFFFTCFSKALGTSLRSSLRLLLILSRRRFSIICPEKKTTEHIVRRPDRLTSALYFHFSNKRCSFLSFFLSLSTCVT